VEQTYPDQAKNALKRSRFGPFSRRALRRWAPKRTVLFGWQLAGHS
jgi:hypothetical protein